MKDGKIDMKNSELDNEKIELAKGAFNEKMEVVKQFIKKSEIYIISTEDKWQDTSSVSDKVITQNFFK